MSEHNTEIQWTHHEGFQGETWNPIVAYNKITGKRGWHCEHVSRGCDHCYAETQNKQGIRMGTKEAYTRAARDRVDIQVLEDTLLKPLHWSKPRSVFVCSMTDLFGEWVPFEWIDQIFAIAALSPQHTFQILTKRPERMAEYLNDPEVDERIFGAAMFDLKKGRPSHTLPLPNVWLGTSCENQAAADERIPHLLRCPAAVRWLSCEPLIGPIDLTGSDRSQFAPTPGQPFYEHVGYGPTRDCDGEFTGGEEPYFEIENAGIHWVVVGGESGAGHRPMEVCWLTSIADQCKAAGVPVWVKQLGKHPIENGVPLKGLGGHGAAFDLWPDDLKVRQFPKVTL